MLEYYKNIISILTSTQKKKSLILFFLILINAILETLDRFSFPFFNHYS